MAEGTGLCIHYSAYYLDACKIIGFRLDAQAAKEAIEEKVSGEELPQNFKWKNLDPDQWHDFAAREIAKGDPDALKGYHLRTAYGSDYFVMPHVVPPLP